jgi:hypothetical protein
MITYGSGSRLFRATGSSGKSFRAHAKEKTLNENWIILYQLVLTHIVTAVSTVRFLPLIKSHN